MLPQDTTIPVSYCQCGCGEPTAIGSHGQPNQFVLYHHHRRPRTLLAPLADRFWALVQQGPGCWLWLGRRNKAGYGMISSGGNDGRTLFAHRVAWELAHGPVPGGLYVCHRCDNPPCVREDGHLFLGTAAENAADMARKRRSTLGDRNPSRLYPDRVTRGVRHPHARLTEAQVQEARMRWRGGETCMGLARAYGVSATAMRQALQGQTWRHVDSGHQRVPEQNGRT